MPMQAYALVTLFIASSIVLGIVAVRIVARFGGPQGLTAFPLPILAAFGAFYLVGHRLGIAIGPEVSLFGFQVALLGDALIGFVAALAAAVAQAAVVRARAGRATAP